MTSPSASSSMFLITVNVRSSSAFISLPPLLALVSLPFFLHPLLLLFSSHGVPPPVSILLFFPLSARVCLWAHLTKRSAAASEPPLTWHVCEEQRGQAPLPGGGKVPLLLLMRPLTALSNTACVVGGYRHTHTQQWIYSRCKHNAYNNKQTQLICGSRCAKIKLGRFRTFSNTRDKRSDCNQSINQSIKTIQTPDVL